ncbi:glucosaminidase domain-containing protein [Chitinophagaceae bacterium LWZ2-11]
MKYFYVFLLVCMCQLSNAQSRIRQYIEKHKEETLALADSFEIPASIIIGTAIMESGAGSSKTSKLLNNHFGIIGKNNLAKRKPPVKTKYKQFETVHDSYVAFCRIVKRKKFYKKLKGENNYTKWVDAISKAGYSTSPGIWKNEMLKTIKKYKLDKLDKPSTGTHEEEQASVNKK